MNTHTLEKGLNLSHLFINKKKILFGFSESNPSHPALLFFLLLFSLPAPFSSPFLLPFFLPLSHPLPSFTSLQPLSSSPAGSVFLASRFLGEGVFQLDVLSAQLP